MLAGLRTLTQAARGPDRSQNATDLLLTPPTGLVDPEALWRLPPPMVQEHLRRQCLRYDYHGAGLRDFGHLAYRVDDIYDGWPRVTNRPLRDGRMTLVRSPWHFDRAAARRMTHRR